MIRCPVLNITSISSPHVDATVAFNGRLDPSNSSWMKVSAKSCRIFPVANFLQLGPYMSYIYIYIYIGIYDI